MSKKKNSKRAKTKPKTRAKLVPAPESKAKTDEPMPPLESPPILPAEAPEEATPQPKVKTKPAKKKTLMEAWYENRELRNYVNSDGRFRSGLSEELKEQAKELIKRLGVPMPG